MSGYKKTFLVQTAIVAVLGVMLSTTAIAADNTEIEGFIEARTGENMIVKTSNGSRIVVQLTDATEVGQIQGMLQVRRKEMSMAALIPGLEVKVEGTLNNENQLVATKVAFKGNDLERAQSTEAGLHETKAQAQQNKENIEQQQQQVAANRAGIEQQEQQSAANKAAIDAAMARFGQLDDYYILDEVTVYFENGKVDVDPKYTPQLVALTEKAKGVNGYMVEVKGYASSSGSTEFNQQLSEDRAGQVTNILIQQGHIPLTRMLAPGAMGESHQVGNDQTEQGEAANRRVVVRLLQNKAVASF